MKRIILNTLALLILGICNLQGQKHIERQMLSSKGDVKYEVGLDLLNFGFSDGLRSFRDVRLILKRRHTGGKFVRKESMRYWRLTGGMRVQETTEDAAYLEFLDFLNDSGRFNSIRFEEDFEPLDIVTSNLAIGFEKKSFYKKIVVVKGIDLDLAYRKMDDNVVNLIQDGIEFDAVGTTNVKLTRIHPQVKPFLGLQYFLTNDLSVQVEAAMSLGYFIDRQEIDESVIEELGINPNSDVIVEGNYRGVSFDWLRLHFIQLNYMF